MEKYKTPEHKDSITESDRIKEACESKRSLLEQAASIANTPEELKFAVKLAAVQGDGREWGEGEGLYVTSSVEDHIVPVERVFAAIDQYAAKQRWAGYGGDIPPYIGERLTELYGPVNADNEL